MSVKRQATTELNHDNWDQDDPADHEEVGSFKIASKDILEKRVIRTAKRRTHVTSEEPKKSVFSGFGGFNKQQPSSFDFLSKVTNGSNENTTTTKVDSSATSTLFTSKPPTTSPSAGLFSIQTTTSSLKSTPGSTITGSTSLFGVSMPNKTTPMNIFTSTSTAVDSPFKIRTESNLNDNKIESAKSTMSNTFDSSKLDVTPMNSNVAKSLFSSTSSPFQIKPVIESNIDLKTKSETKPTVETDKKSEDSKSESKIKYYSKLKHLNESVSEWIKKHVEQTPLCILTPIFKDYEKYIKDIQDEYESLSKEEKKADKPKHSDVLTDIKSTNTKPISGITSNSKESIKLNVSPSSKSLFTPQNDISKSTNKPATFSFGTTASTVSSSPPTFNFGLSTASSQSTVTTSSPFSIGTTSSFSFAANTSTNSGGAAPFSFGIGKPFSFSSNIKQNTEKTEENNKEEDEDTPPKVEYTPVLEENSVYDKKCKIFVKKDANFVDKGVGTLYIKQIDDSEKHQLLVRANTNLGTILLNLILVSGIPIQRMGKNNVMMVCIPTPDSKPPPTPILIRVKTSEEADELLATLDKYKI